LIKDRRSLTLKCLEALYTRISRLEQELAREKERHSEACAREVWVTNEFVKRFPCEATQQILIDLQVNEMDHDFSFVRAIKVAT